MSLLRLASLLIGFAASVFAAPPLITERIDWPVFLSRHDLIWEQLPRQWNEGAFAANGNLGFVA